MARRRRTGQREIPSDSKYSEVSLAKFINIVMHDGKKSVAEDLVYRALERADAGKQQPMRLFHEALTNVSPQIEVRSRRVGGATYQIPVEVRPERAQALAMRWIIRAARARRGQDMVVCLASELSDANQNRGAAVKKREDVRRMAAANRAFSHYRW